MAAEPPPSSPPELSSSKSSSQSPSSSIDEQYDPSHFEDISLAEETPSVSTITPSRSRAPKPRSLVRPALRTHSSPRSSLTSPVVSKDVHESSPYNVDSRTTVRSPANSSARTTWHRGHSTPTLSSSGASPSPYFGRKNRLPPATRANPFPFAPQSPVSPNRQGPPPSSFRSVENSPISPISYPPRRGSWQNSKRKSSRELEDEYHDSDEDLPEDAIVWNVPLTPRPMHSRSQSNSPERDGRNKKERSPTQPQSGSLEKRPKQRPPRSKSWTEAMWELSDEAKALTQALESHADTTDSPSRPSIHHAKTIALPPIRRSDAMIDPFPPSKEKEKFLSRTRPSWLPPKCQKEEKRHLKQWEKMMADFVAAERRKSAASETSEAKSNEEKPSAEAKTVEV